MSYANSAVRPIPEAISTDLHARAGLACGRYIRAGQLPGTTGARVGKTGLVARRIGGGRDGDMMRYAGGDDVARAACPGRFSAPKNAPMSWLLRRAAE